VRITCDTPGVLNLYRRHLTNCRHRQKGRKHRSCQCPLWVEGTLRGERVRRSLDMRSWEAGQDLLRAWESKGVKTALVSISYRPGSPPEIQPGFDGTREGPHIPRRLQSHRLLALRNRRDTDGNARGACVRSQALEWLEHSNLCDERLALADRARGAAAPVPLPVAGAGCGAIGERDALADARSSTGQ
jgi:hypothetical protein